MHIDRWFAFAIKREVEKIYSNFLLCMMVITGLLFQAIIFLAIFSLSISHLNRSICACHVSEAFSRMALLIRQVPLICVEYLYIKVTLIVSFLVAWTWHGWGRIVPRCLLPYTYMVSFSVWKPWILLGQPQNYKSWKLSSFKVRSKLCFCWSSISEKR